MATLAPTEDARNANLDALQKAVDEWAKVETARLGNETKFLQAVLKGRKSSSTGTKNLEATSKLVQESISEYIGVGEEVKL
jgi:hypothetical protein